MEGLEEGIGGFRLRDDWKRFECCKALKGNYKSKGDRDISYICKLQ